MSYRLPRAAATPAPASLPPAGLAGLDAAFSRLVPVVSPASGHPVTRTWHLLDNGERLAELGVTPVGTVLCVHGNPTWSYLWREFVTAATDAAANGSEAWRVIAVDQLEMGFSERAGAPRPLATRVRDLAELTDTLGLVGPVVTFGHDWGGSISLGWAVDHPELLAGVMLLNTAVHQPEDAPVPAPLRLALRSSVLGSGTVATPAFLETTLALAHPPLPAAVKQGYRAPYRGADRRGGIGAFVADIPVHEAHESAAELARISGGIRDLGVPALMLWGPTDPIFSDRYLDDLLDRLPHADVHRFEGAGHLVMEDVDYAAAAPRHGGRRLRRRRTDLARRPRGACRRCRRCRCCCRCPSRRRRCRCCCPSRRCCWCRCPCRSGARSGARSGRECPFRGSLTTGTGTLARRERRRGCGRLGGQRAASALALPRRPAEQRRDRADRHGSTRRRRSPRRQLAAAVPAGAAARLRPRPLGRSEG
ncbi:alpha/beta hydrolase [Cryobacterium sp. TMT3-29-2]|nr:alpha/beta hydrolase [Cryobacterium sp. TMT3-29-2]